MTEEVISTLYTALTDAFMRNEIDYGPYIRAKFALENELERKRTWTPPISPVADEQTFGYRSNND